MSLSGVLSSGVKWEYKGDIKDGFTKHGKGTQTYSDGGAYIGLFRDGKMHGKGKFKWNSGDEYDGDWENGEMHGQGTFRYASGSVFEGQFVKGKMHGKGKMTVQIENEGDTSTAVQEGEWAEGVYVPPAGEEKQKSGKKKKK